MFPVDWYQLIEQEASSNNNSIEMWCFNIMNNVKNKYFVCLDFSILFLLVSSIILKYFWDFMSFSIRDRINSEGLSLVDYSSTFFDLKFTFIDNDKKDILVQQTYWFMYPLVLALVLYIVKYAFRFLSSHKN